MDEQHKFDEMLINEVEHFSIIYDKQLKEFKDKKAKENTWVAIGHSLNTEAEIVRKRWENLRGRFVRAYNEATSKAPSGSGSSMKKATNFPYYENMLWLAKYIRKRKLTSINVSVGAPDSQETQVATFYSQINSNQTSQGVIETEEVGTYNEESYEVGDDGVLSPVLSQEAPISSSETCQETPSKSKKGKQTLQRMLNSNLAKGVQSFTQLVDAKKEKENVKAKELNDGNMYFMRSVAEDMEQIPPAKKIKFKREVMELLEKYTSNEVDVDS